jgi:hypothetical protein
MQHPTFSAAMAEQLLAVLLAKPTRPAWLMTVAPRTGGGSGGPPAGSGQPPGQPGPEPPVPSTLPDEAARGWPSSSDCSDSVMDATRWW